MISNDLLAILCCPETKQDLSFADARLIDRINQLIERGDLKNRAGRKITQKIESGLIRSDQKFLYPIRQDIPIMLADEAVPLTGIL